jgi:hypothetical protein
VRGYPVGLPQELRTVINTITGEVCVELVVAQFPDNASTVTVVGYSRSV